MLPKQSVLERALAGRAATCEIGLPGCAGCPSCPPDSQSARLAQAPAKGRIFCPGTTHTAHEQVSPYVLTISCASELASGNGSVTSASPFYTSL